MQRRKFIQIAAGTVIIAGTSYYLLSDKNNFVRADMKDNTLVKFPMQPGEREILYLAAMAPSGHNTQPWFIQYIEPFHWIICNDKSRWLPGVDPTQREPMLSMGAFIQNLEYAAGNLGYGCQLDMLAAGNQDEHVMQIKL